MQILALVSICQCSIGVPLFDPHPNSWPGDYHFAGMRGLCNRSALGRMYGSTCESLDGIAGEKSPPFSKGSNRYGSIQLAMIYHPPESGSQTPHVPGSRSFPGLPPWVGGALGPGPELDHRGVCRLPRPLRVLSPPPSTVRRATCLPWRTRSMPRRHGQALQANRFCSNDLVTTFVDIDPALNQPEP